MTLAPQVRFGNTGIKVSGIIVGCMSFGNADFLQWTIQDKNEAFKILKAAYDGGLRTFDTADCYSNGLSELILGEFLQKYNIRRETVVIMSKVFIAVDESVRISFDEPMDDELQLRLVNQRGLSRKHIIDAVANSVKRLGTYIDILQIHRFDPDTSIEETMKALDHVVEQGLVRYIGASAMLATQFAEMQCVAEKNGWHKFVSSQPYYNLIYREEERELIPFAKKHNIALTPYSPLAKGSLCRPVGTTSARQECDKRVRAMYGLNEFSEEDTEIIHRVQRLANDKHVSMTAISLAWLIHKGTFPIVGFNSVDRITDALTAFKVILSDEEMKFLEEVYEPKKYYLTS